MSATRSGGVTVKVLTGRTAASLQRYRDWTEEGQEPALFTATQHCADDVEIQIGEWKAVRELHGTQGARRAQKARYESVDPETGLHASGRRGTHVKVYRRGRSYKQPVRPGETPTHLRIEAEDLVVKESEAVHTIYAASPDLVNPESPEQIERFFYAVVDERQAHYPGLQESLWLERNGISGLVHVHVASNATIFQPFELDGQQYRAGRKMAGTLTRVHDVRSRFETYLDQHPEHGLSQALPRVGSKEYTAAQLRSGQRDYWEAKRGRESNQARCRRTVEEVLADTDARDRDAFVEAMAERGVTVTETGLRRGKPGKNHDYLYTVDGASRGVRGGTLGEEYRYAAIGEALDDKAAGRELNRTWEAASQPTPESLEERRERWLDAAVDAMSDEEIAEAVAVVEQLAARERQRQRQRQERDATASFDELLAQAHADIDAAAVEAGIPVTPAEAVSVERADKPARQQPMHRDDRDSPRAPGTAPTPSPVRPAPTAPPAPPPFRSDLRRLRASTQPAQQRLMALAQLEEDYQERGYQPDAEFVSRIREAGGLGRRWLEKIENRLQPGMREQLTLYVDKTEVRDSAFQAQREIDQKIAEFEQSHPVTYVGMRDPRPDLRIERGFHRDRHRRLTDELDAGVLEADTPGARAERTPAQRKYTAALKEVRDKQRQNNKKIRQREADQELGFGM